jgi:hypothetical protein
MEKKSLDQPAREEFASLCGRSGGLPRRRAAKRRHRGVTPVPSRGGLIPLPSVPLAAGIPERLMVGKVEHHPR